MDDLDRRDFVAALAAVAATGVLASAERATAQEPPHAHGRPATRGLVAAPPERQPLPLPFAAGSLPGLSERLLTSHHDNNYGGAVRKLGEIRHALAGADASQAGPYWSQYGSLRAAELAARNSVVLHELYFANLAAGQAQPAALATMLAARFGSVDAFKAQLFGCASASSGWVVLVADSTSRTLELVQTEGHAMGAWDAAPLLVLDVYEHAYAIDYGATKRGYLDAFWQNVAWTEVHARTMRAVGRLG